MLLVSIIQKKGETVRKWARYSSELDKTESAISFMYLIYGNLMLRVVANKLKFEIINCAFVLGFDYLALIVR